MSESAISKVLVSYGASKVPSGRGWRSMKCPFHSDSNASATVSNEDNAFICFACDVKGDIFKIIMEQEGVSFSEAKSRAEEIAGTSSIKVSSTRKLGRRVPSKEGSLTSRRREI